jgi:AbrB family looped-hinge helix DNA binding protein
MIRSKITSKYQTTVPKAVREELGLGPNDQLQWEIGNGFARVAPSSQDFRRWRGAIHVGSGSVVQDVRQARKLRGSDGA